MGLLNGWTKDQVKKVIDTMFIGRAYSWTQGCEYLTDTGKKCGVGLFIPDGHAAQKSRRSAEYMIMDHPELEEMMPLSVYGLERLQQFHDENEAFRDSNLKKQKDMLYNKILQLAGE